ncbi:MAG: hypothetical protein E6G94_02460 [Alphaproteobacteria bacterium]|nr:MAG: hypothetical protein E6G94_02460 [Alphaproteobacteria bacterium]
MSHEPPRAVHAPLAGDAGGQVAQLRHVLGLVETMAGLPASADGDGRMDEAARLSAAYADALPIDRRRFDALASETAAWAASGVETLLHLEEEQLPAAAAASRLARELAFAVDRLKATLRA